MKKIFILFTTLLSTFTLVNAQSEGNSGKFYFRLELGYNFRSASLAGNITERTGNNRHREINKVSLGSGFAPGISAGYMFNSLLGVELQLNYLLGGEQVVTENTDAVDASNNFKYSYSTKMLQFAPLLVLQAELGAKMRPFVKAGPVIGFGAKIIAKNEEKVNISGQTSDSYTEIEYTGGSALGVRGAMGLDYMMSEKLSLFAQLSITALSYAPHKGTTVKYTVGGTDQLSTVKYKEIEYVDSYDQSDLSTDYSKVLKFYFPLSSVGLHFGMKYTLGK